MVVKIRKYHVAWHLVGTPEAVRGSNCVTREGFSTFEDIRKMIAIKRGCDVDQVEIVELALVETSES